MPRDLNTGYSDHKGHMLVTQFRDGIYRMFQEERSIFWDVTISVILSSVFVHLSYSERFPRYSYFTVLFQNR
jgi:Leu/Phe-tRNA-protein transferase